MKKEIYVIPKILLLSISMPINILATLSTEGNSFEDYEDEGDF